MTNIMNVMLPAATAGSLTAFFTAISTLAHEYQAAGNAVLIGIALLILGSKFLIGKQVPYIIIGTAIIMSAFNIAASAGASLTF